MKTFFKSLIVHALSLEARVVLLRRKPKIIVVTGSVGKTSTKDALAQALSSRFDIRKSEKSYNSDIGVPLTILNLKNAWNNPFLLLLNIVSGFFEIVRLGNYPLSLILEVGADHPGDLEKLFRWLIPDTVIVTRFPDIPVHVEFYESPEALIKEEGIPAKRIRKNGLLVLNRDDQKVFALQSGHEGKTTTYGFDQRADVIGSNVSIMYGSEGTHRSIKGVTFKIDHNGNSIPVEIRGALGIQHVYPILAAFAVGIGQGINLVELSENFKSYVPPPGRMKIIEGMKGSVVIDDSYNASPVATEEALSTLRLIEGFPRKIAVLGDMLELGKFSEEEHERIGERVRGTANLLVTVGDQAKGIAAGALKEGMDGARVFQFNNSKETAEFLKKEIREGDVILVKGSQSIRTERIVEKIMAHPELKEKLLVRQEKEWQRR
jgi:UDP-N-acetylmuramoyl-tripeptide--D-alanyl-D-alanine ligase